MDDLEFYEDNGIITVIKGDMFYIYDTNDEEDVKEFKNKFNL